MAIDKTPAVGRLVFRLSDGHIHWIEETWTGRITAVRGKQLTFDRRVNGFGNPSETQPRKLLAWKVAAVCDTEQEAQQILQTDSEVKAAYIAWQEARTRAISQLMGSAQ